MFDSARIIATLTGPRARLLVDRGCLVVQEAASDEQGRMADRVLGSDTAALLRPLFEFSQGFTLRPSGPEHDHHFDVSFLPQPEGFPWDAIYPAGMDFVSGVYKWWWGEMLVVDLADPLGLVYHVCHEPPSHTICFGGLEGCVDCFINDDAVGEYILNCLTREDVESPTIAEFNTSDPAVAEFLAKFPKHYSVHDLQEWKVGAGYGYFGSTERDFWRYGTQRLWVQSQPRGLLERIRDYWAGR